MDTGKFVRWLVIVGIPVMALALPQLAFAVGAGGRCFILIHGHYADDQMSRLNRVTGEYEATEMAQLYWVFRNDPSKLHDPVDSGIERVTSHGKDRYFIIGYNSMKAFWHQEAAGQVARQILRAKSGEPDGVGNRCRRDDRFVVVAHSMGTAVLRYINGNTDEDHDPNGNTAYVDDGEGGYAPAFAPFKEAMESVVLITLDGANNGVQSADRLCSKKVWNVAVRKITEAVKGGWYGCDPGTESLQTQEAFVPRSHIGSLARPMLLMGGFGKLIPSPLIVSEDDGVITLASQMDCSVHALTAIEQDLRIYSNRVKHCEPAGRVCGREWFPTYSCDNNHKNRPGSYNLSVNNSDHSNVLHGVPSGDGNSLPQWMNSLLTGRRPFEHADIPDAKRSGTGDRATLDEIAGYDF
jgi:hypothetical protein